jgi:diguanylate cyclase (GGDEF)-like protein
MFQSFPPPHLTGGNGAFGPGRGVDATLDAVMGPTISIHLRPFKVSRSRPDMGGMSGLHAECHFGGWYTRLLVGALRAEFGIEGLTEVLRRADEARSPEVLSDDSSWSSYRQFRRLLEAAADVMGSPSKLTAVGARIEELSEINRADAVRTLSSPDALYANMSAAAVSICSVIETRTTRVADREWLIQQTLSDGFAPFEEFCALQAGVLKVPALVFGYPSVHVAHEECARSGAPACVFRVRWDPVEESGREVDLLRREVKALEGQLEQFQRTVGDLVSGADLQTVLDRTFLAASRAVRAPIFVLALVGTPATARKAYATGVPPAEAERVAAELLAADAGGAAGQLIAEVASPRRRYGRLAAVRQSEDFLPHEMPRLRAYAEFIAAALDSAWALDEARRQGDTAQTLLELSTALARITSVEEMAAKLVRAVPRLMGSERAAVLLRDSDTSEARFVATYGYPPEVDQMLKSRKFPIAPHSGQPEFHQRSDLAPDSLMATTMAASGTTANIVVPIIVDGGWAGAIVASVSGDPETLQTDESNKDRLRGLAAQACTAIQNARLLDQVSHQAFHDALTGLPNRALILDRAEQMLGRARRHKRGSAALFIDLDGFKEINDTFGHAAGDELLRAVTARLAVIVRPSDTVGRLGGDEFVVLLEGESMDAGPELVAERILTVLREPFHIAERDAGTLTVTASIGMAIGERATAGDLLRDADIALYQAKASGKNRFALFEVGMQNTIQDRLLWQMDVQEALSAGQFFLAYQPIRDLASGTVAGVEALLRWQHPTRGEIQPSDFIPQLEETGLILDLGRWVLNEACQQAAAWHHRGHHVVIAVNVFGRQLQTDRFFTDLTDALALSGLDPTSLVVEITESMIMTDVQAIAQRLRAVRALGVRVAVDDFGTGYSSLAVLREFPVDQLKIDRAFVAGISGNSAEATALIHTLIQLGKTLGLETVAEGIEQPAEYAQIETEPRTGGQEFLIARPLLPAALEALLDANEPLSGRILA